MLELQSLKTSHDLLLAEAAFSDGENSQWATFIKGLPDYNQYHADLVLYIRNHFGDRITVYRAMGRREYEAIFILDAARPLLATMDEDTAKKEAVRRNVLCFQMQLDPSAIIMRGRPAKNEVVIDSCLVLKSKISVVVTDNLQ